MVFHNSPHLKEQCYQKLDRVIVCCDDKRIFDVVKKHGGEAILTKKTQNVLKEFLR